MQKHSRADPVAGSGGALLLFALIFAAFVPTLGHRLTNWDDPDYVTHNPFVAAGWAGLVDAFTTFWDASYYPVTHATYVLLARFGVPVHGFQVFLFASTCALLPFALRPFGVGPRVAFFAPLLWALHPFRAETVSWAANLKDTLGVFFVVASVAAWPSRRWLALGLFTLGLLSKSTFFGLAVVFPLLEVKAGVKWWKAGPFLAVGALAAVVAALARGGAPVPALPFSERLATEVANPWWYTWRTVVPAGSRAVYDLAPFSFGSAWFWGAVVAWLVVAALLFRFRTWEVISAVLITVAAFAPVSGWVPLAQLRAERYTLIPSLVLAVGLLVALAKLGPRALLIGAALLTLPSAWLLLERQKDWHDAVSLWKSNEPLAPGNYDLKLNYAQAAADAGDYALALRLTEDARRINATRDDLSRQLTLFALLTDRVDPEVGEDVRARVAARQDLLDDVEVAIARTQLHLARVLLSLSPETGRSLRLRSTVSRLSGDVTAAVTDADRAIDEGESRAVIELMLALVDAGKADQALEESHVEFSDPGLKGLLHSARATALSKLGREQEAASERQAAVNWLRFAQP